MDANQPLIKPGGGGLECASWVRKPEAVTQTASELSPLDAMKLISPPKTKPLKGGTA